jgi:hypothetical protein
MSARWIGQDDPGRLRPQVVEGALVRVRSLRQRRALRPRWPLVTQRIPAAAARAVALVVVVTAAIALAPLGDQSPGQVGVSDAWLQDQRLVGTPATRPLQLLGVE